MNLDHEIRPIDKARAMRLVQFTLLGDAEAWARTLQEILDDDYGLGELGSLINVLRVMSHDLAGAVADSQGDDAPALIAQLIAQTQADPA